MDAHREFEIYYQDYCVKNQVPLQELNKSNKEKLKKVFPKKVQEVDEEGIVKSAKSDANAKPVDKSLQKMYRAVAQKIHPDKFAEHKQTAEAMGFTYVASGPLVRSSYHADDFVPEDYQQSS